MASPLLWLEALAGLKALYDLAESGVDYGTSLIRHRTEADTIAEAGRVSRAYSTYWDEEVEELIKKIEGCRKRFIAQGSGADRARCFCSIFKEIQDGNGGRLPHIDDWQRMYNQLCLERPSRK
jgi:hypothetical protein